MLKLLFNIAVIYAIWQLFRMVMTLSRSQQNISNHTGQRNPNTGGSATQRNRQEGDYIDYEEIKQ